MYLVPYYLLNQLFFIIISVLLSFHIYISFSELFKINDLLSLNVQILKKSISPGEKQVIQFLLNDTSINHKINKTAHIQGNIIYLSGIADSFLINITPSQWYNYSWPINPHIQKFGTVLVEIKLLYDESIINIQNITFNIGNEKVLNNS